MIPVSVLPAYAKRYQAQAGWVATIDTFMQPTVAGSI